MRGLADSLEFATNVKDEIDQFRPHLPLLTALKSPGMTNRHWDELSDIVGFRVEPDENFTLQTALSLNLQFHLEAIEKYFIYNL